MNPAKLQRYPATRRTPGGLLAPLSKWCKRAIPRWMKRSSARQAKADDNDWSFKDKTLPWNDEVSGDAILWGDVVVGETTGVAPFRGALPEWNEADIVDSAWSEEASFHSDGTSFYAHDDDTSRYPAGDDSDDDDALEDYLNSFFDEVNRSAVDDASPYDDDDDESPYFNDYSSIEIDYDAYPSEIDTDDDDDTIAEAVSAYLDLHL